MSFLPSYSPSVYEPYDDEIGPSIGGFSFGLGRLATEVATVGVAGPIAFAAMQYFLGQSTSQDFGSMFYAGGSFAVALLASDFWNDMSLNIASQEFLVPVALAAIGGTYAPYNEDGIPVNMGFYAGMAGVAYYTSGQARTLAALIATLPIQSKVAAALSKETANDGSMMHSLTIGGATFITATVLDMFFNRSFGGIIASIDWKSNLVYGAAVAAADAINNSVVKGSTFSGDVQMALVPAMPPLMLALSHAVTSRI